MTNEQILQSKSPIFLSPGRLDGITIAALSDCRKEQTYEGFWNPTIEVEQFRNALIQSQLPSSESEQSMSEALWVRIHSHFLLPQPGLWCRLCRPRVSR
jgi:hypothetical protein